MCSRLTAASLSGGAAGRSRVAQRRTAAARSSGVAAAHKGDDATGRNTSVAPHRSSANRVCGFTIVKRSAGSWIVPRSSTSTIWLIDRTFLYPTLALNYNRTSLVSLARSIHRFVGSWVRGFVGRLDVLAKSGYNATMTTISIDEIQRNLMAYLEQV